jgi:DNA-binding response OmpR family regulator/two-component sensor histidine kinase
LNRQKETELNNYKFEFFTNLAHEFRTPLTLIFASAATLIDKMVVDRPEQPYLKNIYTNARRMQHMIDELLAFQKLDSGREKLNFKTGDLVGFAAEITDVFSHFANEKELEITFEPEIPSLIVPFDAEKIERILLNLLSNAIKYTAAGGAITVILKTIEDFVVFIVKDTGIGIAPEILSNIFERYFHHTPQQAGQAAVQKSSGIGLAYTQSLINLHKGKVEVVSKPGEGSTFTVFLPIINRNIDYGPDKMDPIRHKERLKESIAEEYFQQQDFDDESTYKVNSTLTRASKYRILIVEDDFQLLQLLQNLLAEYYEVVTAENGQTALEYLKQKRIDLVVSDVMMPVMDGLTLCKTIKSELVTSHIPVILLTARAGNEPLIEGLETGADGYITKPFHPKHLQLSIEKLLTTRQLLTAGIRQNIESRSESMEQHLSKRDRKLLDKTFAFLKDNYFSEQLNADQLADQLALSKAQLYRKIKAITGLTPHGLIKNYRLNKAREMIIEGKYNITDIVFMVGFNNRTYFYRSFRELFGEAPGELNKTARPKQSE